MEVYQKEGRIRHQGVSIRWKYRATGIFFLPAATSLRSFCLSTLMNF